MIVDFFSGPGGWEEGLHTLGRSDVVGIEIDRDARATRAAAGHATWPEPDVTKVDPQELVRAYGKIEGLIASPPCQDFSLAGLKAGVEGLRGRLVWEPMRFVQALMPGWVAFEQVTTVLPLWKFCEIQLRDLGYKTWTGILKASDYGVPQDRNRAILMATLGADLRPPTPTHGPTDADDLFGGERAPYVTMARALGWTRTVTVLDSRGDGGDGEHHRSATFTSDRPSRTVAGKARSWLVTADMETEMDLAEPPGEAPSSLGSSSTPSDCPWINDPRWPAIDPELVSAGMNALFLSSPFNPDRTRQRTPDEPAATLSFGNTAGYTMRWQVPEDFPEWPFDRPAMTVVGSFRPDIMAAPGWRAHGAPPRQKTPNSVPITVEQAGILQSFPANYPWQGSRTKKFEQIGNALPVGLAAAILKELL